MRKEKAKSLTHGAREKQTLTLVRTKRMATPNEHLKKPCGKVCVHRAGSHPKKATCGEESGGRQKGISHGETAAPSAAHAP